MNWENKNYEGIYYSRFIASWINAGGGRSPGVFRKWLKSLIINEKHIPDEIITEIKFLYENGKLELELNAEQFLKEPG